MIVIVYCVDDLNYVKWFLESYRIRYFVTSHIDNEGLQNKEWMISFNTEIPDLKSDLKPTAKIYQLGN